jgi:hypothetical protein
VYSPSEDGDAGKPDPERPGDLRDVPWTKTVVCALSGIVSREALRSRAMPRRGRSRPEREVFRLHLGRRDLLARGDPGLEPRKSRIRSVTENASAPTAPRA